jgi:hypothetical protein
MTANERERLGMVEERTARIEQKLDCLPDTLIKRLDDRYLTKDAADKIKEEINEKYLSTGQAKLVVGVFSTILLVLGIIDWYLQFRK